MGIGTGTGANVHLWRARAPQAVQTALFFADNETCWYPPSQPKSKSKRGPRSRSPNART